MKVLLISPRAKTGGLESLRSGNQLLQGILYVAAAVKRAGHSVIVVVADASDVGNYIEKYDPEILGISCVTATYPIARDLLKKVRLSHPELYTIIGGHHATFLYKDVIAETDVSYVCRGEGEEVFVQLLESLQAGEPYPAIEGIVYQKDDKYYNDNTIAILDDLESLPRITFDLVEPGTSFTPKIVSSRGCPFHCSFCSISAFYSGKYRQRSVESVIEDIESYISWGYDSFWFHDDNLTVDGTWVRSFCNALIKKKLNISWNCMSRVDTICRDPQLIELMARCGCKLLAIGIESGIPEVLEKMHKKIDHQQINRAIDILNKINISHNWYMILGSGDEFDQPQYIEKNIKFFQSHRFGYVLISILTPFPGTELYHKLESEGRLLHRDYEKYDIVHCVYQPHGMSPEELEAFLPRAYMRVYLSKGWRLIPLIFKSIRSGAIRTGMITGSLKALFKTYVFRQSLSQALNKKK